MHRNLKAPPKKYTMEQRRAAMSALLSGETLEAVSARLGVHLGTLQVWWTDARRGEGPCADVYSALIGRVSIDLSSLQVTDALHRHIHREVVRLRESDPDEVREKLATALFELHAAGSGVVTLSRPQADAVVSLLVKRVFESPDPTVDAQMGRLAIAALRLQNA